MKGENEQFFFRDFEVYFKLINKDSVSKLSQIENMFDILDTNEDDSNFSDG